MIVIPQGSSFDDMVTLKGDKEIGEKINKIILEKNQIFENLKKLEENLNNINLENIRLKTNEDEPKIVKKNVKIDEKNENFFGLEENITKKDNTEQNDLNYFDEQMLKDYNRKKICSRSYSDRARPRLRLRLSLRWTPSRPWRSCPSRSRL